LPLLKFQPSYLLVKIQGLKFNRKTKCLYRTEDTYQKHEASVITSDTLTTHKFTCGNKMPTRCNSWFLYRRFYCLLNMFRAPLCPSSGAQEYYTGGCCLWYLVLWFSSCRSGVELWVMCPVCGMLQHSANRTHNPQRCTVKITSNTRFHLIFVLLLPYICTQNERSI